ncbi:MAG: IPT/TIG domain-containing protein [Verrucomicrobia bacterium]|nr:IPT/TIG domain-containing protein [Verrucomicrobiota bacterium]
MQADRVSSMTGNKPNANTRGAAGKAGLCGCLALWLGAQATVLGAPTVSSFSPLLGVPGTQVTVFGAGFATASKVQFGDAAADFTALADNRLIAIVPPQGISGRVRVTNPTGTGTSPVDFMVAPRVTAFSPARSGTNMTVTIDGFNFLSATNVQFAGRSAAFSATAATQIRAIVPPGATNGPIRISSPAGSAISPADFIVTGPGPIVDSFEPPIGLAGTEVLIHGANFINVTAVRFNTANATAFSTPAQTQLRAFVPAGATTGKIVVTTTGGSVTSVVDFAVSGRPFIRGFNPKFGRDGYTQVTIEGLNFNGVSGVGFNGKPVSGIATPAQNQIVVTVPTGATTGLITLTNASGTGSSTENFIITQAPIIEYFNPIQGGPGTPVTIGGINLSNGFTVLKFGGVQGTFTVTGQNGTQVRAIVPNGAKSGPITMTNAFGSFVTADSFFVTGSAPHVSELAPAKGARGTEVIITGGNFTSPATIRFNGVPDPTAAVTALTQIRATVPAAAWSGPVTVTTASGTSSNGPVFYLPPRLTSITPAAGVVGAPIELAGTNFMDASLVLFNGLNAGFEVTASNRIATSVPADASSGPITVATPGGVIISTNNFKVLPRILSFTPALGPAGTAVTLLGTTFTNVTAVSFNGAPAVFTVVSRGEVRATVPAQATTGPIRLSTADGTSDSPVAFLITRASDLELKMTVSPTLVRPGDTIQFTLTTSNRGPSVVTGVEVSDPLPSGLQVLEVSSDRGTASHANGVVNGTVAALTNGTAFTLGISAMATEMGVFSNRASVLFLEGDTVPANNQAMVSFTVLSEAARTLDIRSTNGSSVVLSWPAAPVPLVLESAASLILDSPWSTVPNPPVVVQGWNIVTNEVLGERYYRLRGP